MVDLLLLGGETVAPLVIERVLWKLGEKGARPVLIWGDLSPSSEGEKKRFLQMEKAESAYDLSISAAQEKLSLREETGGSLGDWLPLTPLLQELIQGAELQKQVRLSLVEKISLRERLRRAWAKFLMRNPHENEPFLQPAGTKLALIGGWERLQKSLAIKHRQQRQKLTALLSVEALPDGGWSCWVELAPGDQREIRSRGVVLLGKLSSFEVNGVEQGGLWRWEATGAQEWSDHKLLQLAERAEQIAAEVTRSL